MLLRDFIRSSVDSLSRLYPEPEGRAIVAELCHELLGVESWTHLVEPETVVPEEMVPELAGAMKRLIASEPLQYVLGHAYFGQYRYDVTPSVLIPRPETYEIVSAACAAVRGWDRSPLKVLDLCTGSGCIAWTVAIQLPEATVVGVDISDDALAVASGQKIDIPSPPVFLKMDLLSEEYPLPFDSFDLIISNPPYVMGNQKSQMRENVLKYEPSLALFIPDEDPLVFYRAIASFAQSHLSEGGWCFVEINDLLGPQTRDIFTSAGFRDVTLGRDLSGRDRMVSFCR